KISALVTFLWVLSISCFQAQSAFTEVSQEAGIDHAFRVDQATFGGGVAVIDFDNDGWEDLYVTGGAEQDALFRNEGDGTFSNVLNGSGLEITRDYYTQGVAAADVDRDGDKDLIVTTFTDMSPGRFPAPNLLFINNGNGTFTNATEEWGLDDYRVNSCGVSFGDINGDGFADMFVANYYTTTALGFNIYNEETITNSFTPALDYLFINTGGRGFVEVGQLYGLVDDGFGFQGYFSDYDLDGDLDILVANDFGFRRTPNRLYRNDFPTRNFTDRSLQEAMNFGMNAMGIAPADFNFDGRMDYYVTNLGTSVFSANQWPEGPFADFTFFSGIGLPQIEDSLYTGLPISWGANFFDYDNDTDLDLFVANGALNPTIRLNPNLFYECDEDLKYSMTARENNLFHYGIGRGSVTFDYDNDGDLDLFVVNQYPRDFTDLSGTLPPPRCLLYRNETNTGNWVKIDLRGEQATTFGLGSRIMLYAAGRNQYYPNDWRTGWWLFRTSTWYFILVW
ncbi:MAG: VCBS repeat-containing protein, partial [Bacteroidota bacterium]